MQSERQDPGLLLAELLASRLCHDLSSPLSGLSAALGEVAADASALDVAREATAAFGRRLMLLRAAWGMPAALPAGGLATLAAGLPNAHRITVELAGGLADAPLPAVVARLLVNAVMLAAESLPRDGTVMLTGDAAAEIAVRIAGDRAGWPDRLAAMLAAPAAAWDGLAGGMRSARLQAAVTALLAHQAGARPRLLLGGSGAVPPLLFDLRAVAG